MEGYYLSILTALFLLSQFLIDYSSEGDPRAKHKDDRRHSWHNFCSQSGNMEQLRTVSEAGRQVAQQIMERVGMDPTYWTAAGACLQFQEQGSRRGPPSITGPSPGFQAFVDLGCCLEKILLLDSDELSPVDEEAALRFLKVDTGGMEAAAFLQARPDAESHVAKVRLELLPFEHVSISVYENFYTGIGLLAITSDFTLLDLTSPDYSSDCI